MTIIIVQKCNGCDLSRELDIGAGKGVLENVSHQGGWRNVPGSHGEHLCPDCTKKIVEALRAHLGGGLIAVKR